MSPLFSSRLLRSKESIKEKIESNKNLQRYTPAEKIRRIKNLSVQGDIKREIIRIKKKEILQSTKLEKQSKLIEKFRKFEIRQQKYVEHI